MYFEIAEERNFSSMVAVRRKNYLNNSQQLPIKVNDMEMKKSRVLK